MLCDVIEVLANALVGIILQYISVLKQHVMHFKLTLCQLHLNQKGTIKKISKKIGFSVLTKRHFTAKRLAHEHVSSILGLCKAFGGFSSMLWGSTGSKVTIWKGDLLLISHLKTKKGCTLLPRASVHG